MASVYLLVLCSVPQNKATSRELNSLTKLFTLSSGGWFWNRTADTAMGTSWCRPVVLGGKVAAPLKRQNLLLWAHVCFSTREKKTIATKNREVVIAISSLNFIIHVLSYQSYQ